MLAQKAIELPVPLQPAQDELLLAANNLAWTPALDGHRCLRREPRRLAGAGRGSQRADRVDPRAVTDRFSYRRELIGALAAVRELQHALWGHPLQLTWRGLRKSDSYSERGE